MTVTLSPLQIDCDFDSGNIQVLDASNPSDVHLAIRPDTHSGHYQWFHFKVGGLTPGQRHRFSLDNASESSYKNAWTGYNAVASYDQKSWFRVPASSTARRCRSRSRRSKSRSGSPTSSLIRAHATTS